MSKYMCLGCWTTSPVQVVLPDGQVITLTKPTTVGALLDRCRNKDGYYVCEASSPGMNSPLFPRVPLAQVSHNPLYDASSSPLQGGALLPADSKLQKGHLYFILPLPELSPCSLDRFRSGGHAPNSLSNLLRRSSADEDLGRSRSRRSFVAGGSSGNQGALKSAIARRISTRISPEFGATLQSAGRPSPQKDAVYKLLAKPPVVEPSGNSPVKPVMQSWHDRPPHPSRFSRRRRRSLRTYSPTWKPELPIISEDGTLGSCLCPPMMSDTDDDSITMLLEMTHSASSPSSKILRPFKSPRRGDTSQKMGASSL